MHYENKTQLLAQKEIWLAFLGLKKTPLLFFFLAAFNILKVWHSK